MFLSMIPCDYTYARRLGETTLEVNRRNDLFSDIDLFNKFATMPKVWTGEYDGKSGNVHVRRRYALKFQKIDIPHETVEGIAYVDKLNDSEYQVKCSYNFQGHIDIDKGRITFQGTSFVEAISNFDFVNFDVFISQDMNHLTGTTDAWDGSEAILKAATSSYNCMYSESNDFSFDENSMNIELAKECMECSLLIYGDSCDDGSGHYIKASGTKSSRTALYHKLVSEGFEPDFKECTAKSLHKSPKSSNVDCIHWGTAKKRLSDGTQLIYLIVKGTTGKEWYGNFHVASGNSTYETENAGKHYSFDAASEALLNEFLSDDDLKNNNVKIVVTGHSRGAAVANIVSKKLTDLKSSNNNIKSVYGYTFATPTVILKEEAESKAYNNIYNFCFDDDFVTYLPLENGNWHYSRYGTTYYATASNIYKENSLFRGIVNNYFSRLSSAKSLSYKKTGAYDIAKGLISKCNSVEEFYEKNNYIGDKKYEMLLDDPKYYVSWYDFFNELFAPIMASEIKSAKISYALKNSNFMNIVNKFIVGAVGYPFENYDICAYVGNTHDPGSYYALIEAVERNNSIISKSSIMRKDLDEKYPMVSLELSPIRNYLYCSAYSLSDLDKEEINIIKEFVQSGKNEELLGWDLSSPETWDGIIWSDGHVAEMNISGKCLTGELDLSTFTQLKVLDCSNNYLTNIELPETIEELYCEGNYLDLSSESLDKIINNLSNNILVSVEPQIINPDIAFDEEEVNKLFSIYNSNSDILEWNKDNPSMFDGVKWNIKNGIYHVTDISLSDKGLSGDFDLSNLCYLENLDLSCNDIDSLNLSNDNMLKNVNVSQNKISQIDISNTTSLYTLYCNNNYLNVDSFNKIYDLFVNSNIEIELYPQFVNGGSSNYDEAQIKELKKLFGNAEIDIDWENVGNNEYFQWKYTDGKYRLIGLDFSRESLSGILDLSNLNTLETINFSCTDVKEIKLPQSVKTLPDLAFANCTSLEVLEVTDSWNGMGIDVFNNCDKLTISCVRNSYAEFIASALDIPFNEVVAISYLTVEEQNKQHYYKNETFSLKEAKLKIYYSDGSFKYITEGYEVSNYDSAILGDQTIQLSYAEDNYVKTTDYNITIYGKTDSGLLFLNNSNNYKIVGYEGEVESVIIPNKIDGITVDLIDDEAFKYCDSLTSISIPSSVETIGKSCFCGCDSLQNVEMSEGLNLIQYQAFKDCSSISEINIPDSVTLMGTYVFDGCENLKKVHLPDNRVTIMEGTFYNCSSLSDVNIPNTVTTIQSSAFYNCESLSEFTFGESITTIDSNAFNGCSSLKKANMSDSVSSLGTYVFANCTSLEEVHINEGRQNITEGLFYNCTSLNKINVPPSVKYIRNSAFYGCTSLEKFDFISGLDTIENSAFRNCTSLKEVTLPNSITALGDYVFAGCTSLENAVLNEGRKNVTYGLFSDCTNLKNVSLPDSVIAIRSRAFENCTSLQDLVLPDSLETIENNAFLNAKINSISYKGSVDGWNSIDKSTYGNDFLYENSIKTISDNGIIEPMSKESSNNNDTIAPDAPNTSSETGNNVIEDGISNNQSEKTSTLHSDSVNNNIKLAKTTISSLKSKNAKSFIVKWKKVKNAKGYQVQYALNKKFTKSKKSKTTSKLTLTVKKLKKGKTYYVRVRAYNLNGNNKVYGKWSVVKKIKIKK